MFSVLVREKKEIKPEAQMKDLGSRMPEVTP